MSEPDIATTHRTDGMWKSDFVEYHAGGEYEGYGKLPWGWYIRNQYDCGGCSQCEPDGPYDSLREALKEAEDR